ncbi:type II toxin-antitoxin system MqsR family toxin [Raoultibacter phocaeensis]|uniref:type II toxin-antitoxin system MqsR family toxin n=1 Tax=Raoultibacter phocaeensis TaxID=2479841 RepID=UPI00111A091A|nr:type II toxin-antitoxin system MqsR family toxin [Raoultibacter phocaeensis]
MKYRSPRYSLARAQRLVRTSKYIETKTSTRWLRAHGYDPGIAKRLILSLAEDEYMESLPPKHEQGLWADVYRCDYEDDEIGGRFYVKFVITDDELTLVLMSCKEWGYGW